MTAPRLRAVIGLGSSLGDRRRLLALGAKALDTAPEVEVTRLSRIYWSPPAGGVAGGGFLNAAAAVEARCTPAALLARCLAIERLLGRRRGRRWADRTLDMDVLWIEGVTLEEPSLTVPHPRLTERAFALLPLLEVAPDAIDPRSGARYASARRPAGALAAVGVLG